MMTEKEPMTEQELADYYQAHRDDPDEWEEIEPPIKRGPGRPSRGLSDMIAARFTPEETAIIRRASESLQLNYSEVLRRLVRDYGAQLAASGKGSDVATTRPLAG
jgi:hypothetical protein